MSKFQHRFAIAYIFAVVAYFTDIAQAEEDHCDSDENDDAQGDDAETEPSFCQEVFLNDNPSLYNQDDNNILTALGTSMLSKTYPSPVSSTQSFGVFDEMPFPVPTGASSFYMVLLTVILAWYFNRFMHWLLKDTAKALDLFPITDQFPKVYLYMLQQSRRESRLSRDARNTWSWLATFYLLKPSDSLVNTEEIFRSTGWTDFEVPHEVWDLIKAVLRVNAVDTAEVLLGKDTKAKRTKAKDAKARKVVSDTGNVSDRNVPIEITGSRRLSADDIGQDEPEERILKLRKLLGEDTSIQNANDASDDAALINERGSHSLHQTTNAPNFDVENQNYSH